MFHSRDSALIIAALLITLVSTPYFLRSERLRAVVSLALIWAVPLMRFAGARFGLHSIEMNRATYLFLIGCPPLTVLARLLEFLLAPDPHSLASAAAVTIEESVMAVVTGRFMIGFVAALSLPLLLSKQLYTLRLGLLHGQAQALLTLVNPLAAIVRCGYYDPAGHEWMRVVRWFIYLPMFSGSMAAVLLGHRWRSGSWMAGSKWRPGGSVASVAASAAEAPRPDDSKPDLEEATEPPADSRLSPGYRLGYIGYGAADYQQSIVLGILDQQEGTVSWLMRHTRSDELVVCKRITLGGLESGSGEGGSGGGMRSNADWRQRRTRQSLLALTCVEIEKLAALRHPNVLSTLATVREVGSVSVFSEYSPAATLTEVLRFHAQRSVPLPLTFIVRLIRQLASALIGAHALGVTHRAVKPAMIHLLPVHSQPEPQSQAQAQEQEQKQEQKQEQAQAAAAACAPTSALTATVSTAEQQGGEQQSSWQEQSSELTAAEEPTEASGLRLDSFVVKLRGFHLSIEEGTSPSLDPGAAADLDHNSAFDGGWSSSDESDDSSRDSDRNSAGVERGRRGGQCGVHSRRWREPPFHPAADAWGVGAVLFEALTLMCPPSYDRLAPPPPPLLAIPEGAATAARVAAETAALSVAPHPHALKRLASRQMLRNPDAFRRTTLPELMRALDELEG